MKKILLLSKFLFLLLFFQSSESKAQNGNYLDLSSNCYVEVYNFNNLLPLQTGTISFWFKINDLSFSNILFSISNKNAAGANNNEYYIAYRYDYKNIQSAYISNGTIIMDPLTPNNSINDNNWHNFTLVSDNVGAIQIYLNGTLQTITPGTCCGGTTNDYFFGDNAGINNMKIGALERNSFIYSNSFSIDDFRIWNKALSASEVSSSITSASITPVANLVLYYDFEQKENLSVGLSGINDVRDETGNNQHGDIICGTIKAGIEQIEQSNISMIVYPNPAVKQLTLNIDLKQPDMIEIQIFDQLGKVCFQSTEKVNGHYSTTINTSDLSPGYYTVAVKGERSISHAKFIKN